MFFKNKKLPVVELSHFFVLALMLNLAFAPIGRCEPLQGGVEVNESLPEASFQKLEASAETAGAALPKQDCVCFNNSGVELKNIDGNWKIVDKEHWILDFGTEEKMGQQALDIVRHYKLNNICFVGRPFQDGKIKMMYFLSDGQAPEGAFSGEDAISFDPARVKAQEIDGRWKLVQDSMWMLDFDKAEQEARNAEEIVKYYGFTRQCFVGRPGPPMMYWRK